MAPYDHPSSPPRNNSSRSAGRITSYVVLSALTASCSGLIYGYNIGISGGVASMNDFLQQFFPNVVARRNGTGQGNYCKFDDQGLQAFTSSLYISGLMSTFAASYVTKNFGRRMTLIIAGLLSLIGVALSAGGQHLSMLIVGRIFLGFGAGFANQAAPIYLSEIAPTNIRGLLNSMFQMNIGNGIFAANLVNLGVGYISRPGVGWRIALAGAGVPSLMLMLGGLLLVETPISLIERGRLQQGKAVLQKVRGTKNVEEEFEEMVKSSDVAKSMKEDPYKLLLQRRNRPQLIISVMVSLFQQFTGINAVMFYSPVLFSTVGFESNASLYSAAIIGAVNVIATIISMMLVDKMGRKKLLVEGGLQMLLSQIGIGVILAFTLQDQGAAEIPRTAATIVVFLICIFVAGFGWSWGPVTWLICSELFPLETRSAGQGIVVFVNLAVTFSIAQAFLSMLCAMQYGIFFFFAGWVVFMSLFVLFCVPETKNIPLDCIDKLYREHWIWKRIVPADNIHNRAHGSNNDHEGKQYDSHGSINIQLTGHTATGGSP